MSKPWRSERVLVTGAASGIGRAFAVHLAAQGIEVLAVDTNADGLDVLAGESSNVIPAVIDVTDHEALAKVVADHPCDGVVTSAAIGTEGMITQTDPELWRKVATINYLGTVWAVGAAMPEMLRRGRGTVVVLSSSSGGLLPTFHEGPYSPTKAAISAYARALRQEVKSAGIQVACVYPPAVDTPLLDQMQASRQLAKGIFKPMPAEGVVRATERALRRGRFAVVPGFSRPLRWLMRISPELGDKLPGIVYRREFG